MTENEPRDELQELKRQVERQAEIIQQQNEKLEKIEKNLSEQNNTVTDSYDERIEHPPNSGDEQSRRQFLSLAASAGIGYGASELGVSSLGRSTGDTPEEVSFSSDTVIHIDGSIAGNITGNRRLTDISGNNLEIDENGVLNATSGGGGSSNDGTIVAAPGEVQRAIDEAAAAASGVVRLNPTKTYTQDSSFPWHVKSEVTLDFNGAVLYGSGKHPNTDIIHVHPQGQVHNPKIDLWNEWEAYDSGNPYDGRVFTFDAKYGAYFADGTTIQGGWTKAVESTGTWMYFGKNNSSDSRVNRVTSITIETNLRKANEPASVGPKVINTAVHLDSSGPPGFLNSLVFRGIFRGASTMILQEGAEPNNAHIFDGVFQQPDGSDYFWYIKPDTSARGTVVRGTVWDVNEGTYPDGTAWYIDSQRDELQANAIRTQRFPGSFVQNNSNKDQYIIDSVTNDATIV